MHSASQLLRLFAAVLTPTALAAGCASSPTLDDPHLIDDPCNGAARFVPFAAITPAAPVDYLELRPVGARAPVGEFRGAVCATAKDQPACRAKVDAIDSPSGFSFGGGSVGLPPLKEFLVYTRGDEVGLVASAEALRTFPLRVGNRGRHDYCRRAAK